MIVCPACAIFGLEAQPVNEFVSGSSYERVEQMDDVGSVDGCVGGGG